MMGIKSFDFIYGERFTPRIFGVVVYRVDKIKNEFGRKFLDCYFNKS